MRLLAGLTLLLQLQPLVGSALCFHQAEVAREECPMPQEEPASGTLTTPYEVPSACPSMGYCAPTAPAVPKLAEHFQITSLVHAAPAMIYAFLTPGETSGPPFHPPRA